MFALAHPNARLLACASRNLHAFAGQTLAGVQACSCWSLSPPRGPFHLLASSERGEPNRKGWPANGPPNQPTSSAMLHDQRACEPKANDPCGFVWSGKPLLPTGDGGPDRLRSRDANRAETPDDKYRLLMIDETRLGGRDDEEQRPAAAAKEDPGGSKQTFRRFRARSLPVQVSPSGVLIAHESPMSVRWRRQFKSNWK